MIVLFLFIIIIHIIEQATELYTVNVQSVDVSKLSKSEGATKYPKSVVSGKERKQMVRGTEGKYVLTMMSGSRRPRAVNPHTSRTVHTHFIFCPQGDSSLWTSVFTHLHHLPWSIYTRESKYRILWFY